MFINSFIIKSRYCLVYSLGILYLNKFIDALKKARDFAKF